MVEIPRRVLFLWKRVGLSRWFRMEISVIAGDVIICVHVFGQLLLLL